MEESTLDARKRQLLAALLREKGVHPLETPILRLPRRLASYPTSFAQERLWLIDQIEPGNVAYNTATSLRLAGSLRPTVLARTLSEVVRRHEVLRTTFAAGQGGTAGPHGATAPVQVIAPAAPLPLPLVDLSGLPTAPREAEASRLAGEEAWRPFDLARGPVLRVQLLRLAADDHALLLTVHHIASDGWSTGIFIREVSVLYPTFLAGRPSPLPELAIQYADFAAWQRQVLDGDALARSLAYWRRQLAGSRVLEVPTDRPRPPVPGLEGGSVDHNLPAAPSAALKTFARAEGATLFMLFIAAWAAVLARWSGVEGLADVNVGTPIANRGRTELEGLIGFFINTLVIRADLAGDPTFRALLGRVRKVAIEAFEHQDMPFTRIVEELRPERSLSHTPVFQVLFGMGNAPSSELAVSGLTFSGIDRGERAAMFELNLTASEGKEGLRLELEFRRDLFDEATARRMLDHLSNLLGTIAEDPDLRLSGVPVMSVAERHAVLCEWNDAAGLPLEAPLLAARLLASAAAHPGAVALTRGAEALSYGELAVRSARLAAELAGHLSPAGDRLVGLCAGRSPAALIGLLAILRSGAGYLPLDPAYPAERLRWILADAAPPVLLAEEATLAALPSFSGEAILLDSPAPGAGDRAAKGAGTAALVSDAEPAALAYVLYTSGSTGRPKGVAMTRGAVANLLAWQEREPLPGPARTLHFASLNFDVSFQEIVATWLAGGTLVLPFEEERRDPHALAALLERERIERLFLPFVALGQVAAEALATGAGTALRDVVTAGEQLQVTPALAAWLTGLPGCRLHNQYGPTETHVMTAWTLAGDPAAWPPLPPIGRPITATSVVLLDAQLQPVPIGVTGELAVGGAAPARGYLNRPELTAERFVPDVRSGSGGTLDERGGRLYKTGDLARLRSDGAIEFLGRADDQVKVRGVRIEPGEVEAVLAGHPAVAQAVVVARPAPGEGGGLELAAYYVLHPAVDPAADPAADQAGPAGPAGPGEGAESDSPAVAGTELRDYLRARLPETAVPARYLALSSLPLTPSGKVDRRALARMAPETAAPAAFVAPRTPVEQILAGIWGDVLGVDRVSADADFFDLGGHSLLATRVTSRIREVLSAEVPQRALFEDPTLAGLARRVEAARELGGALAAAIEPVSGDGPFRLSFAQERLWLIDQIEPGGNAYNLPSSLRLAGPLLPAALAATLTEIARRHETLRTTFTTVRAAGATRPVSVIAPPAAVPVPVVDLAALPPAGREDEAQRLVAAETARPFDLARGPVLRVLLVRLAAADHALALTVHHIASDDWSSGVLVREVMALYEAFSRGLASPLEPLPVRYVDYAEWQRRRLDGEGFARALAVWRQHLGEGPPVLELATDRPRPLMQGRAGDVVFAELPAGAAAAVHALARREGSTLFMVLMAAYQALLGRWAGQADFGVGTVVAGRDRTELEGLIGFFVNTLVFRVDLQGAPSLRQHLARVRDVALDAFAHQEIPFERLVEEINPRRSLAHSPLFQALFVLQNAPAHELVVPGLAAAPFATGGVATKFDLTLSAVEASGEGTAAIGASLQYRTELWDAATARRLLAHFGTLVAAAAAEPDRRLSELPLMPPSERAQVLLEWSVGEERPVPAGTLHGLFEASAVAAADRAAVVYGGERLTYGELNRRADRLARRLAAQGVATEMRVGICLERSLEAITAILAVLKAGGAYVPLDPTYPPERLAYMAEDAGLQAVLARSARPLGPLAAGSPGPRIVLVDDLEGTASTGEWDRRLEWDRRWVHPLPENLAYVLYTSGSTGRPKGVAVPHFGVVNTVAKAIEVFGLEPESRVLQIASLSFDASVIDIFATLAVGGCLYLVGRDTVPSGADLAAELRGRAITAVHMTPSVMATIDGDFPSLRRVVAGAEVLPGDLARRWSARCRVLNVYGPTEASVFATWWESPGPGLASEPPIGRPIPNARTYVLDAFEPAPVGVPGELHLGGIGPARGYFGRPDLTAASFVPDPFAERPGARLYRTGDRVRFRPDGELEMLGRIDQQVKVRGFRIELGEVEAALAAHPGVAQCAVAVRGADSAGPAGRTAGGPRLVAYVVARAGIEFRSLPAALRSHLRERLPEFMVPSVFVPLAALPIKTSGKLDRAALPDPEAGRPDTGATYVPPSAGLESALAVIWQQVLGVERVGADDGFFDLGGHSLLLVEVQNRIRDDLGREVALLDLFRYPSVAALARHLAGPGREGESGPASRAEMAAVRVRPARETGRGSRDVAIVGMAGRFPGAPDLGRFWQNLAAGVESISFFPAEKLAADGIPQELLDNPAFVGAGGVLAEPELFDATFFDVSPREAQLMDPQQRVFLECASAALERAGYGAGSPAARAGRIGVFAGTGVSSYGLQHLVGQPGGAGVAAGGLEITLGNDKDYVATRVAYKLDLRGPALSVQTACSTSLVAVHLACKSLFDGECEMAVAGGVSISFPQTVGYVYSPGGVTSDDGHNRAFDARATGTISSDGVGAVVLKPLAAALADGDPLIAVIKATAINNDGAEKAGFTTPSEAGQAEVIAEAQALAGVTPESIQYVEAHGTATPVGDPIEVAGLIRAFRAGRSREGDRNGRGERDERGAWCALGSVKTNIGHTGSAAGVAGLIKTALSLQHRQIPASLHYRSPNPAIDFAASPFRVATALADWPENDGAPRRAGVSSFGLGGTNAHAVLEEAPPPAPSGPAREWHLLSLSARSATALEAATDELAERLRQPSAGETGDDENAWLADAAYTLHVGRRGYEHRRTLVGRDREDAAEALASRDPRRVLTGLAGRGAGSDRPVAFLLSGLGEQYPGLARGLYAGEPGFRERFDRAAELFLPELGVDLRTLLFPPESAAEAAAAATAGPDLRRMLGRAPQPASATGPLDRTAVDPMDRTAVLQPALFALEHALAGLWMEWGVRPQALIGYSLGEYVAACLAGVVSLEDAVRLVAARARLIDALPEGAMLAVSLPESEVLLLLPSVDTELSPAAVNGPETTVVAGPEAAVAALESRLAESGTPSRRLRTTHAFHSRMMEPAAAPLIALARGLRLSPPRIPYLSNVTGTWITDAQATDPAYWAEHLRRPVRFSDGIGELWREPGRVLLEVGPGQSLATLALQHPGADTAADPVAVGSLPSVYERRPDRAVLLDTLGKLWLAGVAVEWPQVYGRERRRRVILPTYPLERRRYLLEPPAADLPAAASPAVAPPPSTAAGPGVYLPSWRRTLPLAPAAVDALAAVGPWLVFLNGPDVAGPEVNGPDVAGPGVNGPDVAGPGVNGPDEPDTAGRGLGARIAAHLRQAGAAVTTVAAGERFGRAEDEHAFVLDPGRSEDYESLLAALESPPRQILHLWSLGAAGAPPDGDAGAAFDRAQDRGLLSLLALFQAFAARWPAAVVGEVPAALAGLRTAVVSAGRERLTAGEAFHPERSPVAALGLVLPYELPGAVCRSLDVVLPAAGSRAEDRLAAAVLAEVLRDSVAPADPVGRPQPDVLLRGGDRWVRSFELVPQRAAAPRLTSGGAVLLIGQPVGPALGAAAQLVGAAGARLALAAPAAEAARAAFLPLDPGLLLFTVDPGDEGALREVVAEVERQRGPLCGLIVADPAGDLPALPLAGADRASCRQGLARTAQRLAVVDRLLAGRELDLCLLITSLAGAVGGPGQILTAGAALYAAAVAEARSEDGPTPWTCLAWGVPWEGVRSEPLVVPALSAASPSRLLVSPWDPLAAVPMDLFGAAPGAAGEGDGAMAARRGGLAAHPRPNLRNPYVEPSTELERAVTAMWEALLGLEQVGIHDSFFDLGGDSLLGTQVLTRARETWGVDVPLAVLFETPTPAALAQRIEALGPARQGDAAEIAALLERLDSLSPEEVERMLAERGAA